tara:strand:- start:12722 stop:13114 length:393 start_codon:yes stop_codon:yes gene_type:complete
MFDDVAKFHLEILGVEQPELPTLISKDFAMERFRFLAEETNEFLEAMLEADMTKAVDGLLDTIYVALGTLYFMGVPVQECWNAVQKANMSKRRGVTKRGNALDAVKPPGWVAPEAEIAHAILKRINGGAV